jgi:hypothetical protein
MYSLGNCDEVIDKGSRLTISRVEEVHQRRIPRNELRRTPKASLAAVHKGQDVDRPVVANTRCLGSKG